MTDTETVLDAPGPQRGPATAADSLDTRTVTTLRFLAADAVQEANSGHPGLPLGMAVPAWVLFSRYLRHDPTDPRWPDRDRFVLSAGHGSMLLYGLLHLFGYDLPIEELRRFRQWGSATPGHPEYGHTPGVETTTGPLGQGIANAVGMALAERMLAQRCNTDEHAIVDHRTWVIAGDGDLMEGISHEAASLAGHLGLGRLTVIFDDNDVTIDGPARQSCSDDVLARFASYGWHVLSVEDGNDAAAVARAYDTAIAETGRPTLIAVRTTIGFGAPTVAGTSKAHGSPLGDAGLAAMRAAFGWPGTRFHVPDEVTAYCARLAALGSERNDAWRERFDGWRRANPDLAQRWRLDGTPAPPAFAGLPLPEFETGGKPIATRSASGEVIKALAPSYPGLVGGSADLAASTNTTIEGGGEVAPGSFGGRTIHFGIREHAMGAMLNGIALHGGLRPYGSTFLVFADYMRPAIRLAALMRLPAIFIFTHDSIAVGEDGPTHQPIEQLESLRLIPGLTVLRPADANETVACWRIAAQNLDGPTALVLSRQKLPVLAQCDHGALLRTGSQRIRESGTRPDVLLAASGSEVGLALAAADRLAELGVRAEVRSIPWRERFAQARRESGEPEVPTVWVEAGVTTGWRALAGTRDRVIGLSTFGASAPGPVVLLNLGLTVERVVAAALDASNSAPNNSLNNIVPEAVPEIVSDERSE
ncbi:MAG TPA: transketolase [Pseudonocardiaceae bacterium]